MGALNQGLILMTAGMSAVFVFLIILVFVVKGFEFVAPHIAFLMPDPEPPKPKAKPDAKGDAEVALAIAAALRNKNNG